MNISDEAVEAAGEFFPPVWTSNPNYRDQLIRALEAAAPHLMRQAWEAGCLEGLSYNPGYDELALAQNPYKKDEAAP